MDGISAIARAVLYEGYILWPYRRSALKNQQRWTFGGVFPVDWAADAGTNDPGSRSVTVYVEGGNDATLDIAIRFLQVVRRRIARGSGVDFEYVDELTVGNDRFLAWDEATEREATLPPVAMSELTSSRSIAIDIPADDEIETLTNNEGAVVGAIHRNWSELQAELLVLAERAGDDLFRVTARVTNSTDFKGDARANAMRHTMVSMHIALHVHAGEFISVQQPPEYRRALIDAVDPDGLWPVLVGHAPSRDTMLAAPIILSDYPDVASESPGDLFDGGEIDQLLILNVLALTEDEQREMRDSDPRAREILERCQSLTQDQLMRLHGVVRDTTDAATVASNAATSQYNAASEEQVSGMAP